MGRTDGLYAREIVGQALVRSPSSLVSLEPGLICTVMDRFVERFALKHRFEIRNEIAYFDLQFAAGYAVSFMRYRYAY